MIRDMRTEKEERKRERGSRKERRKRTREGNESSGGVTGRKESGKQTGQGGEKGGEKQRKEGRKEGKAGKRARQENTRREKDIPCRDIKKGGTNPPFFFVLNINSFPNNVGATRSLRHIADNRSPPTFG